MSEPKWTRGPWSAFNMVHEETGERMTPEEVGEYVANCMRLRPECDDFLFISVDTPEGERDVCHIGNGPDGPYNAVLIAAAPSLYRTLEATAEKLQLVMQANGYSDETIDTALKDARAAMRKARGES